MDKLPTFTKNAHGTTFHEIPDSVVVLVKGGVYKQTTAFVRGRHIYAKHGSGFVQLSRHGTGVSNLRVDAFDVPGLKYDFGNTGRMVATAINGVNIDAQVTKNIEA